MNPPIQRLKRITEVNQKPRNRINRSIRWNDPVPHQRLRGSSVKRQTLRRPLPNPQCTFKNHAYRPATLSISRVLERDFDFESVACFFIHDSLTVRSQTSGIT